MPQPDPRLAGIIVVNERYFPDNELAAAKVGATSFTRSVLRCLQQAGLSSGIILYQRDEGLTEPRLKFVRRSGVSCAILRFNFDMLAGAVSHAIGEAATLLLAEHGMDGGAMLYYQTDALLGFHPDEFACCVTHHGPFVQDFVGTFSADATGRAFGDPTKALHLLKHQELGLSRMRSNDRMFVMQHSNLQRDHLVSRGVDERRIRAVRPPIVVPKSSESLRDGRLREFVEDAELLVFTAVARLDYFKNVDLLVDASVEARRRGVPLRILTVGGGPEDEELRQRLRGRLPAEYSDSFLAIGKLSKPQLWALFDQVRSNGVFVCPSRYETLGITPLEAALAGVCTLITNSPKVEARRFFPDSYRFEPGTGDLADAIERLYLEPASMEVLGKGLQGAISAEISEEHFERDTLSAWSHFSHAAQRVHV
ncbi:glycosyltransferase family 4 protein [Streptomyces polyrhachis]|uniref:Glycosyltransferase family 4 protein n=1 Tax=Streptomyces polyrhachis TaxID=1282885 RepID=A0ABW2GJU9_9ACTN